MSVEDKAVDHFLEAWTQELGRAIQMFNGEQPVITCGRIKELTRSEMSDLLWWKQTFEGNYPFTTWIGAKEVTWSTLGGAFGASDPADAKSTYLEMIGQAQSGAAAVVSMGLPKAFRCGEGQIDAAPPFTGLWYAVVGLKLAASELPALTVAMEPPVALLPSPAAGGSLPQRTSSDAQYKPMLERLMDLQLPLSVALGRAQMPVRDVLKVSNGSVIELDTSVGEYVELIVHDTVVARGEVVSIKGNYGVRIKEIISRQDRISLYGKN